MKSRRDYREWRRKVLFGQHRALVYSWHLAGRALRRLWRTNHLMASLPVLLVVALSGGLALACWHRSSTELIGRYLTAADRAIQAQNFAAARSFYHKAITLGENRPEVRYNLSLCLERLERPEAARALLIRLAEPRPGGFAPAHLRRARQMLVEKDRSPAAVQEAIVQLELAVAGQPGFLEAQLLLGNLFWSLGRLDEAEAQLRRVADIKPATHLMLVKLSLARGDTLAAQRNARTAYQYLRPLVEADGCDEASILGFCNACEYLEEYAVAVTVLRKALVRRDTATLRQFLGIAYANWAKASEKQSPNNAAARLRLLEEGLQFAPNEPGLLKPLLDLSHLSGDSADSARATLERLLTEGQPSGILHLMLGLDAWQRGQPDAGRLHLEQAYRLTPDIALVSNNLAYMLADGPEPDLTRALALAEAALKRWPDQPHFLDTRGQILVKQGRYREALADLERAQRSLPELASLHAALATAYDNLGMPSIAERHRRQAGPKARK